MAQRLSRRAIASYVADKFALGEGKPALRDVAAYLVATGRTREQELMIRDIEATLADRGIVIADVASAYPLDQAITAHIAALTGAKSVALRQTVDPDLLGGIRIDVPGKRFDGTIAHKLTALKAKQL